MTGKKYAITCLISILSILIIFVAVTYIFDPYFHYHRPYNWVSYELINQRYQNDGILKNFEYNAIIAGTSMVDNFNSSEFDKLFSANSVKVPFAGATYKEVSDNLLTAIANNDDIKIIVRAIDISHVFDEYDQMKYDENDYPWYLYDTVLYNDVKYIFNKTVFFDYTLKTITRTIGKKDNTTFDNYCNWHSSSEFAKEKVDNIYKRNNNKKSSIAINDLERNNIKKNFTFNIINIAKDNPNIEFYVFFPPYSIYYWDDLNQKGNLGRQLDGIEYAMGLLVEVNNIHLYSFINEYNVITNLDNYRDTIHYSKKISSQMLVWMKDGHDLLTKDNYKEYMKKVRKFYTEYNYDKLFEE